MVVVMVVVVAAFRASVFCWCLSTYSRVYVCVKHLWCVYVYVCMCMCVYVLVVIVVMMVAMVVVVVVVAAFRASVFCLCLETYSRVYGCMCWWW